MRPKAPTLPAGPLQTLILSRRAQSSRSLESIATDCGLCERTLLRYLHAERLTIYQIDRTAIKLGIHPANLYGLLWLEAR